MEELETEKKSSFGGCFVKVFGFIFAVLIMMFVQTCSKSMSRQYYRNQVSVNSDSGDMDKQEVSAQIASVMDDIRETLPRKIDPITTAVDVELDDSNYYYICDIDDSDNDFSTLSADVMKKTQTAALKNILPSMKVLVEKLIYTDRGLVYRYRCTTSGVTRDIKFSKVELAAMMR